jgi:hypothetical protein
MLSQVTKMYSGWRESLMPVFLFLLLAQPTAIFGQNRNQAAEDERKRWSEPIFGPEMTFIKWNPETEKFESLQEDKLHKVIKYVFHLHNHLIINQPPAEQFRKSGMPPLYIFTSPDGWDFMVTTDPGVVEIKMSPETALFFEQHASNIQDAIFTSAHAVNLYPALFTGGGHISIGKKIFEDDALLFRNFLVDFFNHAELSMGIMGYDTNNALPLNMLHPARIEIFKSAIQKFDRNYNPAPQQKSTQLETLRKDLVDFFDSSGPRDAYIWKNPGASRAAKFHAFNLGNFWTTTSAARVEIRSVRPQTSFDVFVRQIRLFRNRLKYLKRIDQPIPFKPGVRVNLGRPGFDDNFDPPVDPQEALRAFYKYVRESGENWQDHRDYLWPAWVHPLEPVESELSRFERSRWFQKQERKQTIRRSHDTCRQILNTSTQG